VDLEMKVGYEKGMVAAKRAREALEEYWAGMNDFDGTKMCLMDIAESVNLEFKDFCDLIGLSHRSLEPRM
jgi:hypothetical protein